MTRCSNCRREQRAEHLTGAGLCVFCAPPATWPSTWRGQAADPREVRA